MLASISFLTSELDGEDVLVMVGMATEVVEGAVGETTACSTCVATSQFRPVNPSVQRHR